MTDKTTSGEPTFGITRFTTTKVKAESGTIYVAYHDGETWYEGHYEKNSTSAPVQIAEAPVSLA